MPTILSLPALTTSTGNIVFPVVDVNVTPNLTKKATLSQIKDYIGATVIAPQGYTGSSGSGGYTGSSGAGYTGSQGVSGYVGSTGIGYTGSSGAGYTGSASTEIGYTGSIGYVGSRGQPSYIAGSTSTFSALPALYDGEFGDLYITLDDQHAWAWILPGEWNDIGSIVGYTGSQGELGYTGSAGYVGSASTVPGYVGSASTVPGYVGSAGEFGYTGSYGQTLTLVGTTATSAGLPELGFDDGDLFVTEDNQHVWARLAPTWIDLGPAVPVNGYTGSVGSFSGTTNLPIVTSNSTNSTSTDSGALIVTGGAGIGGDLYVGGSISSDSVFVLKPFTTSTLATIVSPAVGSMVFVTDAPGGAQPAYYDGSNWFTVDGRVQI